MKKIYILILTFLTIGFIQCTVEYDNILVEGCNHKDTICEVTIGNQIWMCKNLDVDHYRNGDSIPEVRDSLEWANLKTGAWCYYNNDPAMGDIYGKLYNWYAVNDPRGLAPDGWHEATDVEWTELGNCLGGSAVAGGKLKSTGTIGSGEGLWQGPNTGATNESGFSALPGGYRSYNGRFGNISYYSNWWSSSESSSANAIFFLLFYMNKELSRFSYLKSTAFSVRCVKD